LQYRRVDRYLTPLPVPVETIGNQERRATTRFHRPLHAYVNALGACGFVVDCMKEIATQEIPLFLGLRAVYK
jgi:hypothetical protein